jgi:hypothetical protein
VKFRLRFARLAVLALVAIGCGAARPTPLQIAEGMCQLEVDTVIRSGACDDHPNLDDCPEFLLAYQQCRVWLLTAEEAAQ